MKFQEIDLSEREVLTICLGDGEEVKVTFHGIDRNGNPLVEVHAEPGVSVVVSDMTPVRVGA